MYFYYFTILLFFFPALLETSSPKLEGKIPYKNFFISLIIIICILQMGLRWETGTDWEAYLDHYNLQSLTFPFYNPEDSFEKGYTFLVLISKLIIPEYWFFLFIHSIILFLLIRKSYSYFSPYSVVSLLIFYVSFLGIWGSSRQLLAMGFGLLSLIYLYERKWLIYLLLVFIAFQFHTTSLLLLIFLFLKRTFSNITIISALVICAVIGFSPLPLKIFSLFGGFNDLAASKTTAYLNQAKEVNSDISLIGFMKRLGIFGLFFFYRKRISENYPKFNFIFNGYLLGLCFYFLFVQTLPVMISRGSLYFNVLEPILLSYIFCIAKDKRISFLFAILLLIYSILMVKQSIIVYPELFDPYKGLFINTDYHRNM